MILFLWFLVLGTGLGSRQSVAWLDAPVSVADDRALRLDVQTASIMVRAQITRLVVCSALDKPLVAYDGNNPDATGCNTPGFLATQVFPIPETATDETVKDLYHVRQRARSTFIKKRLLDPHSPTVWLQATLEVRDEHGRIMEPAERVDMVRYQMPERALAVGESMPALSRVDTSTFSGKVLNFLGFRDQSENEEAPDYDELDGLEVMNNGTSTRFYNHVHWSSYTALIFAGLFAVILFVGATLRWSGCGGGGRRRGRRRGGKSRDHLSDEDDSALEDLESGRQRKIRSWAAHVESTGLYHSEC
jgi:hypothetical protein